MAKIACCFNCVYSYCDREQALWGMSAGVLIWPACANQPEAPGRMQRVLPRGICPNYRPRPAPPEGDIRRIPLGEQAYAYVDAADFDWLNQWKWSLHNGYAARKDRGKTIYLHREIVQAPQGMVVDHLNHNRLDDTRANLNICTQGDNLRNTAKRRGTASRFRGLHFCPRTGKWCPRIRFAGKYLYLGSFAEEVDAARARDRATVEYVGPYACLNFPEEWPFPRRQEVYAHPDAARKRASARKRARRKAKGKSNKAKARGDKEEVKSRKAKGRNGAGRRGCPPRQKPPAFGPNHKRSSHKDTETQRKPARK